MFEGKHENDIKFIDGMSSMFWFKYLGLLIITESPPRSWRDRLEYRT